MAIVEINNENSLLQLKAASLPDYYRADVLKKWNQWLKSRYGTSEKLAVAWGGREELGPDLLPARLTTQGGEYLAVTNGPEGETRVALRKAPEVSWHAQLHWPGLTLEDRRLGSAGRLTGVGRFDVVDGWRGLRTSFTCTPAAEVWRVPIETASMAQHGLERVYQGSALLFVHAVTLPPRAACELELRQEIGGLA